MHDDPKEFDSRVRRLDESVERLRTDVSSLKLELATLISALRESQPQSKRPTPRPVPVVAPARTPSFIPAAAVVVMAAALLLWQLAATKRADRETAASAIAAAQAPRPSQPPVAPTIEEAAQATEPPLTPLVRPTIYKGTLTVTADHPGADVYVNRKPVGKAPVRLRNLRAGAHLVWIESEGYRRWTRVITVPAERVTRVSADLEPIVEDR